MVTESANDESFTEETHAGPGEQESYFWPTAQFYKL